MTAPKRKPRRGKEPSVWIVEVRKMPYVLSHSRRAAMLVCREQRQYFDDAEVVEYVRRAPAPKRSKP